MLRSGGKAKDPESAGGGGPSGELGDRTVALHAQYDRLRPLARDWDVDRGGGGGELPGGGWHRGVVSLR